MSVLSLSGQPLVVFTLDYLPSWNDLLTKHWRAASATRKEWRRIGSELAGKYMKTYPPPDGRKYLIDQRAMIVVKVYRPSESVYDVHNACIKNLCDGFTDAMVWPDDEWAYIPIVVFMWAGYTPHEGRFEIEIHELDRLFINGQFQTLPKGRVVDMDALFKGLELRQYFTEEDEDDA